MEKTARRQYLLKWQLILGAVVCAFVAFCALPGSVIAADAKTEVVEYVDREWKGGKVVETTKSQECTVLTRKVCEKGLTSGWYVLNKDIKMNKAGHLLGYYINVSGNVNIILKDGCTLDHDYQGVAKRGIVLEDNANLTIYEEKQTYDDKDKPNPKGRIIVDGGTKNNGAGITVPETATLNIKGGTIEASGTEGGAGIGGPGGGSAGNINIYGGTVTAKGTEYELPKKIRSGAGIGGGNGGDGGTTTIYGGTVYATGGSKGGRF